MLALHFFGWISPGWRRLREAAPMTHWRSAQWLTSEATRRRDCRAWRRYWPKAVKPQTPPSTREVIASTLSKMRRT
jgi:hypothetical protein